MKHKEHRAIEKLVLGKEYPEVDRWMDQPAYHYGPGHRKFRHDARAVVLMALVHRDPRAGAAALLHIAADLAPVELKKAMKRARR